MKNQWMFHCTKFAALSFFLMMKSLVVVILFAQCQCAVILEIENCWSAWFDEALRAILKVLRIGNAHWSANEWRNKLFCILYVRQHHCFAYQAWMNIYYNLQQKNQHIKRTTVDNQNNKPISKCCKSYAKCLMVKLKMNKIAVLDTSTGHFWLCQVETAWVASLRINQTQFTSIVFFRYSRFIENRLINFSWSPKSTWWTLKVH